MTPEEYRAYAESHDDWAPGWDAIDAVFEKLYPGRQPEHFATNLVSRAMLGGTEYLDGYSIYTTQTGTRHIVTYGMTSLYVDDASFGGEYSGWGYEMTIHLPAQNTADCMWAVNMLGNLARYTYTEKRWFEPLQYVAGDGSSICRDRESLLTGLLIVPDTLAEGVDSVHGRVDFLQLVGITQRELEAVMADSAAARLLVGRMKEDDPLLRTDLDRKTSYL